jgi:diguanylate cyclase (GGDEF)-like protein
MNLPADNWPAPDLGFFLRRHSRLWVVPAALALCGAVALVDGGPGRRLSCLLFYLAPVALAAWWGGFPAGVLLSLAAAVLRHLARAAHGPADGPAVWLWDGAVHFGVFTLGSSLVARLRLALARERTLARTDALTGVANARTFYERARLESGRARRTRRPFTVVYLDLDNFKQVNDRLGHPAGDELLRQVAAVLRRHTRATDLCARLGGDEFALFLPDTDAAGGAALLADLRDGLRREIAREGWPISCSIGAATFCDAPQDVEAIVRHADSLMYAVKREGKDDLRHAVVVGAGLRADRWVGDRGHRGRVAGARATGAAG